MKVKLDKGAFVPEYAHEDDAGMDLKSPINEWLHPGQHLKIDTGVHMAIPKGYFGLITSKSGLMAKGITSRGCVDSGYTGSISAVLFNHGENGLEIRRGDKITQIVILKAEKQTIELVDELEDTERGTGGFGSTGR